MKYFLFSLALVVAFGLTACTADQPELFDEYSESHGEITE